MRKYSGNGMVWIRYNFVILAALYFFAIRLDAQNIKPPTLFYYCKDTTIEKGYFFLAPYKMRVAKESARSDLMIISGKGNLLYWKPDVVASDFKRHSDGRCSYFNGRCFILLDSTLNIIDSVACVDGAETDSHDFLILANGHYVLIGNRLEKKDLSAHSITKPVKWRGAHAATVRWGVIQELDSNKKLIYEWNSKGQFQISDFNKIYFKDTARLDVPHFNSVDVDAHGNYLVSARYTDELVMVEKNSGQILWRFGGKHSSFTITGEPYPFKGQHDARFLPNGNILLFDNGYSIEEEVHNARAAEYKLDLTTMTAVCVYSSGWPVKLVSESTGSAQRIGQELTLVNYGRIQYMTNNITCSVNNSKGEIVFDLAFADTMGSYRTYWYKDEGVHLSRPEIFMVRSSEVIELHTRNGLVCQWSNGETSASIKATKSGTYYSYLRRKDGSYIFSDPIEIDVNKPSLQGK